MTRSATLSALLAGSLALVACSSLGCAAQSGRHAADSGAGTPDGPVLEVTARSLNVRAQPSTSGAVIGSLKKGTRLRAPAPERDGWLYVQGTDGLTGYVSSAYVRPVAAEPAAAAKGPPARAPQPGTPLARIELGMREPHVLKILGEPTTRESYVTGKTWIPYYYGSDTSRMDFKYKGVGRVVFGRNRWSGVTKVIRIDADPSEDGY